MKTFQLFVLAIALFSSVAFGRAVRRAETGEALLQYGYNPPRVNPDYCIGIQKTRRISKRLYSLTTVSWQASELHIPHILVRDTKLGLSSTCDGKSSRAFHTLPILSPAFVYWTARSTTNMSWEKISVCLVCFDAVQSYIHCIVLALYTDGNRGEVTFPLNIDDPTGLYHYRIMVNYVVCDQYLQCEDSMTKNSCSAGHGRALRLRVCTFHDHPEPLSKIPRGRHEWSLWAGSRSRTSSNCWRTSWGERNIETDRVVNIPFVVTLWTCIKR